MGSDLMSHNLHYCNVNHSRALKEHERLEKAYKTWLTQRDKTRRSLIAQIDRMQSSDKNSTSSIARVVGRLQAQLEKMDEEDKEEADPEYLQKYPHSLISQRAAYRKLSFEQAMETSNDRIQKAEEAKQLAQEALGAATEEAAQAVERSRRDPGSPFKLGVQLDSFLGRLNSNPNSSMTRKVSLNRSMKPEALEIEHQDTGKWASKWGFHDVRASTFRPKPRVRPGGSGGGGGEPAAAAPPPPAEHHPEE